MSKLRQFLMLAAFIASGLPCISQTLVNGVQPSAINGITVATGAAINGITLTAPLVHTFTFVDATEQGGSCSGTSCTMTIPSTSAGQILFLLTAQSTNVTISSVSGCGTWVTGTSFNFNSFNSAVAGMNAAYTLATTASCTSVTVTVSSAPTGGWDIFVDRFGVTPTSPAPTLDQLAATNLNSTTCTGTCTGSSFTGLTGGSDLLLQAVNASGSVGSPSAPYVWDTPQITAYALNTNSATAPSWSESGTGGASLGFAIK